MLIHIQVASLAMEFPSLVNQTPAAAFRNAGCTLIRHQHAFTKLASSPPLQLKSAFSYFIVTIHIDTP